MSADRTQHQSSGELRKSRDLSVEPTRPPAEVPGYSIKNFLGSGAFGEVWSAIDRKTGRRVAIKFYSNRTSSDVEQLAREVQKLAVLAADRYVVQLLDVGWEADPPYYVMDYIENGSLEDRLKQQKTLPTSEAVELFKEICNGMMHLHGKGILHCDLKPGNILLDQDGKPRVADFGQSRLSEGDTPALGTLFFMAPEQADLDAVPDACWDVYALGALLYSMLVGKPPYYSKHLAEGIESTENFASRLSTYRQTLNVAATPVEHRQVPGVDRQLADIIDRCIDTNPKKRFASIQSVMLALRQRELMQARRPLLVLGLVGPLLLMVVMALFGWSAYRRAIFDSDAAIVKKAIESNEFAAKFAARSAAEQIDEYFRVVKQLAKDPQFQTTFMKVIRNQNLEGLRNDLSDPNENQNASLNKKRRDFIENDIREELTPYLLTRMNDTDGDFPKAASWLVYDRAGNQLDALFDVEPENDTRGRNYSYRSYFTGLNRDLVNAESSGESYDVATKIEERTILKKPHLSAIFQSKANANWKIAFSAPIVVHGKVEGVVAVTVEMGNFVRFQNGIDQYVMLIDGRQGEHTGAILEHPLYDELLNSPASKIPLELTENVRVNLSGFDLGWEFQDPVSTTKYGEKYDRQWIASPSRVESTFFGKEILNDNGSGTEKAEQKNEAPRETGLIVVAVESFERVTQPIHVLGNRLGQLAAVAGCFLLAVTIAMWFLVLRMLKESRRRLERVFSPTAESNSLAAIDTGTAQKARPDAMTIRHDTHEEQ